MLISTWLTAVRNRIQSPRVVKRRSGQKPSGQSLENLETRALLTSPTLVSVRPNVGDILLEGETRTVAPRELTLQFNPGQQIDASTLASSIQVTRGGADRNLNGIGDVPVTIGFVGIGDHPEEVVVRFAENLPDDVYRITIRGTGLTPLKNQAGEIFNNRVDAVRNFRLDLGAVVEGVVPQPVLRDKNLNLVSVSQLADGDRLTINVGSVTKIFEFNSSGGISPTSNAAINFTSSSIRATVLAELQSKINAANLGATATVVGNSVKLTGDAFTPTIVRSMATSTALTVTDGGLVQRRNMVIVHFNEDDLNVASAQDRTFYRLTDTAGTAATTDDRLYVPSSVVYSPVNNTAVLTFSANLPVGTFALRIGSNSEQETLAGAIGIGTILGNGYSTNAFLGGSLGVNDVDLYNFNMVAVGRLNVSATPVAGHDVVLRLFNSGGVEVFSAKGAGAGAVEALNGISLNPGTYYLGVSSVGNDAYTAGNSASSSGGSTTGAYSLNVQAVGIFTPGDLNSSFNTATNLGTLGAAPQAVVAQIQAQATLLPPTAGGNDEPGHRDIPAESHIGSSGTTPVASDGIRVVNFYFGSVYGRDPQNNILYNGITENQKQRAREIFEIWSKKTGIMARETSNSGIQIITGDLRAFRPLMPPNAAAGLGSAGGFAIMNGNTDWGASEYGGGWFNVALHEIGHALGLDHAYDLISVMGEGEDPTAASTPREPIFPTDHDIVHLQRLDRPDGNDIDMYQFQLPTSGKLSAEVIAERQASNLDSVLRLYDANKNLIAQNDNYFSGDSFIGLNLSAGTYYLGLSSTGNDNYNPAIADTGANGTTDGVYQLKLQFDADATNKMVDAPLNGGGLASEFDGDADGNAGGEYEFFFQVASVANTIFVDKAAGNGDGSIATPYNNIGVALLNANPGSVVRIVGNGGTDGNELTPSDALSYLVGIDPDGAIHTDGGTLEVPQGVTLMIDADAVIKLESANLDAGTSAQGIDRSNGAIQILGLPGRPVYLTSYLNDNLGGDSNGVGPAAAGGNWGGVVFRDDSDYEAQGIFLNYVNKANITFGGGQVDVNSVPEVFTPIHLVSARPTITFNTITNNAKAAMSANPNSFEETADRVGPEIHGNTLINNSLNGMFVRVKTELGKPVDTLDVQARFDDDDIVHIVTENIVINGNPGGPLDNVARLSGRLAIDPGMIIKMGGSRIESTIGNANLIAEGTGERPVIFTSTLDDQFGVGGTFDSTNNRSTRGAAAGDWGGLVFNATSMGSIDHAIIRYGGGKTPIEGDFNEFNVIEIHQADVRLANSRLEFNDSGTGPAGSSSGRNGRGANVPATIFVRGAQPIIVNNEFRDNNSSDTSLDSFIISIDVNSLNSFERLDRGRSTGFVERFSALDDNTGPLISQNRMRNNDMNGMQVRGGTLTTQVVWDDTDIVHVLQSEVYVPNHHTFSGVRLQSRPTESLVVKLLGANAGFTAGGVELDINDRIGGTVQVIGSPGFPVVMTSLNDDSVGAGFDLDGFPVLDTNNDGTATTAAPGDWRSVKFEQYSNDRNVRVVIETEKALTTGQETLTPQLIGTLAPNEKSGDDNRPVGFEIHGHVSPDTPSDVDTYSFKATAGSEIWLDLDRTSSSLDSVLELVSAAGSVLARSSAGVLSGLALPMQKAAALGGDYYTFNQMDEGFRVILPGAVGAEGTYFVRVRSNLGTTSGAYQLQIRVNQRDEIPGSTVRFADMRYASNGIEMYGMPGHSPLTGEAGESLSGDNNGPGGAEFIGDLLSSDQNTISVSGNLSSASDVDFFSFSVDYQFIQAIAGVSNGGKSWATIFDIDYADGLTRPDTILSVYDSTGKLIFVSRDSDILDDQPVPGNGTGVDDLTRGSVGKLDAFLGTVALPERNDMRYYVAVSSNGRMPAELQQTFIANAADPLARLEPINSLQRIVEDHIGYQGYSTLSTAAGGAPVFTRIQPAKTEGLFDISSATKLDTYVKAYNLSDVSLFGFNGGTLTIRNPFTGAQVVNGNSTGIGMTDMAMRPDGVLFAYTSNSSTLQQVNPVNAGLSGVGGSGIPTFGGLTQNLGGMAFRRTPEVVSGSYELYVANNNRWDSDGANDDNEAGPALWRLNASTGGLIDESSATGIQNLGPLPAGVTITGLAFSSMASGTLFAVDSNGGMWRTFVGGNQTSRGIGGWTQVNLTDATGGAVTVAGFSALTLGPQNVEDGAYASTLFATGTDGELYAFSQTGVEQVIFDTNADGVADSPKTANGGFGAGIAFSPLDFNLWHPTLRRSTDLGHGINAAPDNSRVPSAVVRNADGRTKSQQEGSESFYFGLEQWQQNPRNQDSYIQYAGGQGQFGVLNENVQRELSNNATIANTYNLPGGASGSLVTNSFSLEGYKATDRPSLYFNYFLDTDDTNRSDSDMQDGARVFASTDGGNTWKLVATNNSARNRSPFGSGQFGSSELPAYASHSATQTPLDVRQTVQELFDNTGTWRQARIDLGQFGGSGDVKLRFDFTTSGKMNDSTVDGQTYGNFADPDRNANNQREGFYIDDLIVGIASRGEMATTSSAGNLAGAFYDAPTDPSLVTQHLSGEYQLEIRRGTEFGTNGDPLLPTFTVGTPLKATERLVSEYTLTVPTASVIQAGDSYTISNGIISKTFIFNPISPLLANQISVSVASNATKGEVANALASAINNAAFAVVATTRPSSVNSDIVDLTGATDVTATPVAAPADLTVAITPTSVLESAVGTTALIISRTGATTTALSVTVSALNPVTGGATNAATLTDGVSTGTTITITIPIGQPSITLQLDPTDNLVYQGTRPVLVRAVATGLNSISDSLDITDNEVPGVGQPTIGGTLQLTLLQSTVTENAGNKAVTGYVTIRGLSATDVDPYDGANPLVVSITSSDGSEIRSTSTQFVDGQMRAFFSMDVIDEFFAGGSKTVTITAAATGYTSISGTVNVTETGHVRFVDRLGDKNLHRQQGMVVIESNTIRDFSGYGVISDEAIRAAGNQTGPGSVRNLATLNRLRLIPGVTIRNNIIANIGTGGILFSGDSNNNGVAQAPVPFGKIVNNTIYGGTTRAGVGIQVEQNASPTLLNNIIANTNTAIAIDGSSSSTVVGTTLFKNNGNNGTQGSDFINLAISDPLFVNAALNNFYPAPGSLAVDSSLNSLGDRPTFIAVNNPLGIPVSDVVAPDFDLYGQKRLDDDSQDPPPGLGSDIFKDRGAVERADFVGPFASFTVPAEDNNNGDLDPLLTRIHVDNLAFPTTLSIDLLDSGIGVDDTQVKSAQFQLRQNGVLLVENVDYRWRYNPNNNRVYFISVTTFPTDTRYSISIDNSTATGVRDLAGNRLRANQLDGSTVFTLLLTDGVNDAPVNNVPGPQSVLEDTTLVFNTANNNLITLSDRDAYLGVTNAAVNLTAADGVLDVTLTATNGLLSLSGSTGLTFLGGTSATNRAVIRFTGTVTDINLALDGLTFEPVLNYFNNIAQPLIEITTSDLGNFGPLPATVKTTTDTIAVRVTAVNDPPTYNLGPVAAVDEDAGLVAVGSFIQNLNPGAANETLTLGAGSVTITPVSVPVGSLWTTSQFFATAPFYDTASNELRFLTAQDVNGSITLRVDLKDGLLTVSKTFVLTVNPLNDEPYFTLSPLPITNVPNVTIVASANPGQVAEITSKEDQSLQNINVPLINLSQAAFGTTARDELATQTLTWLRTGYVRLSGNLQFDVLQVQPDGTLEYRPKLNTAGVAEITIQLVDSGSNASPGNDSMAAPIKFTIVIEEVNDIPVAVTRNYVLDKGYNLLLDAGPSYDVDEVPFGDTQYYEWDLNNDGQYDIGPTTNPQTVVTWASLVALGITAPSQNTIGLRVTDSRGASSTDTASLTVLIVDYGDAPDSYGTTKGNNGAAHVISGGLLLGTQRDEEISGQPTAGATGDGADEDGVSFPVTIETSPGVAMQTYIDVRSTGVGKLDAWLDLNRDGDFDHATEHLFGGISRSVLAGVNRIFFTVPAGSSVGASMMRFRLSSAGSLQPTDATVSARAKNGEVEDYAVEILAVQAPVTPTVTLPVDFNLTDGQIPQTTDSTPVIAWSHHPENYSYTVEVRNAAGTLVHNVSNLMVDSTTIPSSLVPGEYSVRVSGRNKAGTFATAAVYRFQVVSLVVSSPSGDIGTSRPTITWNHVPGSTSYTIQIDSLTTSRNVVSRTIVSRPASGPSSFLTPFSLPLGRYAVRIRATDADGLPGDWGQFTSFSVRTAPVLTGPAATVTTTSRPTFTWTAVTGAEYYQVQLFNMTDNVALPTVTNIRTNSYVPTTSLPVGRFRVIVTAFNASNESSLASQARFFNLAPVPVVVNPSGRLDDATPTFAWQAVLGADKYELTVKRDFGNFSVVYRQIGLPGNVTQHTMLTALPLGRYTYEVRALNDAAISGQAGAYSSISLVTTFTSAQSPVITGPASTTFLPRPVFTWTNPPLSPASSVSDIRISIKQGASYRVVVSRQVTGTSFTPTSDLGIGSYKVEVRTYSSVDAATVSNWSVARNFRVTTAPTLIGPSGRVADATPTLNWAGVLGGQTYQVEIFSVSKNVVAYTVTGINALNFTVPADLPIGQYQFKVQARSAFGELSDWSPSMNFQIVAAPLVSGPASSTFTRTPSFAWNDMSGIVGGVFAGATSYDFSLDFIPAAGQSDVVYPLMSTTSTDFTVTQTLPLGQYQATVRARNADTVGDYSTVIEFYVGGNPVVNAIGSTTDQTPTITWKPVDGAAGYSIFISLDSNPNVAVVQQTGIGSTSFTVPTTLAKGGYRVWVRAVNASNGALSGPMLSDAPSITFTIVDASDVQTKDTGSRYTLTSDSLNMSDFVSESTISMLPSFVSGSPQALVVIAEQSVDAELQIEAVDASAVATEATEQNAQLTPQTDEVLAAWDQQKWWDSANATPVAVVVPATAVAAVENVETKSSTGLLGSLMALAPWALLRRRKDDSST